MPIEPSSSLLAVYSSVVADEGNDQTKDEPPSALTASICVQYVIKDLINSVRCFKLFNFVQVERN